MKLSYLSSAMRWMPLAAVLVAGGWQASAMAAACAAGSTCVFGSSGGQENSMTKEAAREHKEQWDTTRNLRNKVNTRSEKEFDKIDNAIDDEERCDNSLNASAYWEPNTRRCLDRNSGRPIAP